MIKWAVGVLVITTSAAASLSGGAGSPFIPRPGFPPAPLSLTRITNEYSSADTSSRAVADYGSDGSSDADIHESGLDHPDMYEVVRSPPKIDPETLVPELVAFFDEHLRSPEYINSVRMSAIPNEEFLELLALTGPLTPELIALVARNDSEPTTLIPRRPKSSVRFVVDGPPVEETAPFVAPCNGFILTTVPRLRAVLTALRGLDNRYDLWPVNVALHHLTKEADFYIRTRPDAWLSILFQTQMRVALFIDHVRQSERRGFTSHDWAGFTRLIRLIIGRLITAASACTDPAPVDMGPVLAYVRSLRTDPALSAVLSSESHSMFEAAWRRLRHVIRFGSSVALLVALRSPLTRNWAAAQSIRNNLMWLADTKHPWTSRGRDMDILAKVLDDFVREFARTD